MGDIYDILLYHCSSTYLYYFQIDYAHQLPRLIAASSLAHDGIRPCGCHFAGDAAAQYAQLSARAQLPHYLMSMIYHASSHQYARRQPRRGFI